MIPHCKDCCYCWPSRRDPGKFECHFNPPQIVTTFHKKAVRISKLATPVPGQAEGETRVHSIYPMVTPEVDGCARWERA